MIASSSAVNRVGTGVVIRISIQNVEQASAVADWRAAHNAASTAGRVQYRRTVEPVILPTDRDPRFITIRRGGTLTDADHRMLAVWAAACAEHVLHLFEAPYAIRELVLDDQRLRNEICWSVFEC
jgi:hypothetical protein